MKKIRNFISLIIGVIITMSLVSCMPGLNYSYNTSDASKSSQLKSDGVLSSVDNEYLRNDLKYALSEIGVSLSEIKDIKKTGTWANGDIYTIAYNYTEKNDNINLYAYSNANSTISSINYKTTSQKIYARGYEPYKISDFYFDNDYEFSLEYYSKEYIRSELKYPSTVKWKSIKYGKNFDLLFVDITFTAKNSFNVNITGNAVVGYVIKDDGKTFTMVYYKFDNDVKYNKAQSYLKDESNRAKKEPKYPGIESEETTEGSIVLNYGETGEYGKNKTLDGYTTIEYRIPYGKYKVKNLSKTSVVFVASDTYHKNSDGYYENDILSTTRFTEKNEEAVIEVKSGYHIEISRYSSVELILQTDEN